MPSVRVPKTKTNIGIRVTPLCVEWLEAHRGDQTVSSFVNRILYEYAEIHELLHDRTDIHTRILNQIKPDDWTPLEYLRLEAAQLDLKPKK